MTNEKRLIDANALLLEIEEELSHESPFFTTEQNKLIDIGLRIAAGDIRHRPTVDAVEVVHGRWVFGTANHREYMKCSVCLKSQTPTGVFTYCPNCGAKMDGGGND